MMNLKNPFTKVINGVLCMASVPEIVFDHRLSSGEVRLLMGLMIECDGSRVVRLGKDALAERFHMSKRSVDARIKRLEALGYIKGVHRQKLRGTHLANDYQLQFTVSDLGRLLWLQEGAAP